MSPDLKGIKLLKEVEALTDVRKKSAWMVWFFDDSVLVILSGRVAMSRTLFLFCYDISERRRHRRIRRYLQGYKVEGQKSVFECWMTAAEYAQAMKELAGMMDAEQDRIHVFQLDPRQSVRCFGVARHFTEQPFIIG